MRYGPEGKPYVPPICPTPQEGYTPDLTALPFELVVDPYHGHDTDVWGIFFVEEDGEMTDRVETASIHLSPELPITQKLHTLNTVGVDENDLDNPHSGLESTLNPFVEQMRIKFCERVAKCKGIVDGECWALGQTAVEVVIEQALHDYEEGL